MEPDEFYVYPGGSYFICGGCGWSLSPYQPERRPFKMRVCCFNSGCPKYLVVFLIGDEHRIAAFDTGERATVTTPTAGGGLTAGVGGQMQATTEQPMPGITPGTVG